MDENIPEVNIVFEGPPVPKKLKIKRSGLLEKRNPFRRTVLAYSVWLRYAQNNFGDHH